MLNRVAHRASSIRATNGSRAFSRVPFRVHRGAIAPPSDPIHDNQRVECTWTIRSDVTASSASPRRRRENAVPSAGRVEKLKVLLPGLTIVRVRPEMRDALGSDAVARVRVTSNCADVLRGVHVASRWPNRTLLGFHAPQAERELTGHLLTEIDLPHAHAVRNLAAIGLGDVVVHKEVLYAGGREDADDAASKRWGRSSEGRHRRRHSRWGDHDVNLFAANDSRLFVDASTTDMRLEGLRIGAMGVNSRVAFDCGALDLQRALDVGVVGGRDGGISITVDSLIASRLKLMAIGNGELDLTARRLLEVDELKTFAMGNGVVHVHAPDATSDDVPRARTSYQATAAIGAACVDTASLAARRSKILTVGSNDLSLHARDALRVRSVGSSVVECVDRLPRQLDVRGLPQPTLIETLVGEKKTTADATDTDAEVKYPTAMDAFEREALLSRGRSRFFSRFSKSVRDCHWHGSDGSGGKYETETWSGRRRHRRHGRWADDAWV